LLQMRSAIRRFMIERLNTYRRLTQDRKNLRRARVQNAGFEAANVYFHLMAAYAILRHNGVDVGKQDFLGPINWINPLITRAAPDPHHRNQKIQG
jgi:Domain of unknown function (DUF1993)